MEAIIQTTLNKAQADALFEEECIFMGEDVVPEYRIVELFGAYMAEWAERNIHFEGYLQGGRDYNEWGIGSLGAHRVNYYKAGFYKVISHHNAILAVKRHQQSPAGQIIEDVWEARAARQAAADAEDERRMNEAKAKRAAARAARKAAKEAQQAKEKPADRAESQQA